MRLGILVGLLLLATSTAVAAEPPPRTLTFEDRVKAQEAIERVYYSHQIGAKKLFEQAVPRSVLESKVHKYLDETAALKVYWKTAVTDEMLQRELERMASGSRMPERLLALYAALGNDSFLVKECLARAILVDRLARDLYAFDPTFHADARRRAEELSRQLTSGELGPTAEYPNRFVFELVMTDTKAQRPEGPVGLEVSATEPLRRQISPDEFRMQRVQLPSVVGQVSALKEERSAFVLSVVLSESPRELRVANYFIPKTTWDAWWGTATFALQGESIVTVAEPGGPLSRPIGSTMVDASLDRQRERGLPCAADTWSPTSTTAAPSARGYHTAVWTGSVMVVWGGIQNGGGGFDNIGGRYDPATDSWTSTSTTSAPSGRARHTALWTGSSMVVWGGIQYGGGVVNTGGRYDPAADTWTPTSTTAAPSARGYHTAVWTGSVMVVWGGYDNNSSAFNTGGLYDPAADTWTPTSTTGAPSARFSHTAAWTGNLMLVWGGYSASTFFNTGGRYNPLTDTWTSMSTTGAPSGRIGHTAVWTGSLMVVWGGANYVAVLNDGRRYDPGTDSWTPISGANVPSPRDSDTSVWTGSLMVVWGAYQGPGNTGGRYDPAADTWMSTSTVGAPSGRYWHTAVWAGSVMIVWGGEDSAEYLATGGLYSPVEQSRSTWFRDVDGDGYGDATNSMTVSGCVGPLGYVSDNTDCDDSNATIHPGATENCNGIDDNCNGQIDEGLSRTVYRDADGDGYGDPNVTQYTCYSPVGWVPQAGDCNDANAAIHPGAVDTCDGVDNNCNGLVDEDAAGVDSDGDGIHNACDNCPLVANPTQTDSDGDHVGNACDNCINTPNSSQADADGDGRGDACDNCPTIPNGFQDDSDADQVGDACDNCPLDYNPTQSDFDHDGEGDICDFNDGLIYIYSTDKNYREWQPEAGYTTWNSYRGSLSVLRATGQFTQAPGSNPLAARACGVSDPYVFDADTPAPGDVAFNLVTGVAGGVESSLGTNSAGVPRANANPCP